MSIVQLEHRVHDFEVWKGAFDSDPIHREASGVRRYEILRPIDDPNYVAVDLEFDDRAAAEAFVVALHGLWQSPQALAAMGGATPQVRIVEAVETRAF